MRLFMSSSRKQRLNVAEGRSVGTTVSIGFTSSLEREFFEHPLYFAITVGPRVDYCFIERLKGHEDLN